MARNGMTPITLVGNVVADPELRFTPSGLAVLSWRMASTPRVFDKESNDWVDGETLFLTCNLWRQPAENAANTLTKGMRVIVEGVLKQRAYTTREGEERQSYEIEVEEVGPSLRYATAAVQKVTSTPQQGHQQTNQGQQGYGGQGGFSGQQQAPQGNAGHWG